ADDPARLRRIEARSEIIAARNIRIAERERVRREAIAREAAERAAAEAAEAAALEAARKAEEEAREAGLIEQARLDVAAAAKLEALLAIRRAGRKKKSFDRVRGRLMVRRVSRIPSSARSALGRGDRPEEEEA